MSLRYLGLLDGFCSDMDELDLSREARSLKIRRIPRKELEDFMFYRKPFFASLDEEYRAAIDFGKKRYWIDYHYEIGDSKQVMIKAANAAQEEMKGLILTLRLFKEGWVNIVFSIRKGTDIGTLTMPLGGFRSSERPYSLTGSELRDLQNWNKTFTSNQSVKTQRQASVRIAFSDGYERLKLEDKIIDYMIGLEALYLQGERMGEASYKIAHRVSVLLAEDKKNRQQLFGETKKSYNLRSKIVHGDNYHLTPENVYFCEDILRRSIKRFLKKPKPNWLDLIF